MYTQRTPAQTDGQSSILSANSVLVLLSTGGLSTTSPLLQTSNISKAMFSPSLSQSVHRMRCWQPRDSLSKVFYKHIKHTSESHKYVLLFMCVRVFIGVLACICTYVCVCACACACTLIPLNLSGQLISSSHVKRAPGGTLLLYDRSMVPFESGEVRTYVKGSLQMACTKVQ